MCLGVFIRHVNFGLEIIYIYMEEGDEGEHRLRSRVKQKLIRDGEEHVCSRIGLDVDIV